MRQWILPAAGTAVIIGSLALMAHSDYRRSKRLEVLSTYERSLAREIEHLDELRDELLLVDLTFDEWQADVTARVARLRATAAPMSSEEFESWLRKEHLVEWEQMILARELGRRDEVQREHAGVRAELEKADRPVLFFK